MRMEQVKRTQHNDAADVSGLCFRNYVLQPPHLHLQEQFDKTRIPCV